MHCLSFYPQDLVVIKISLPSPLLIARQSDTVHTVASVRDKDQCLVWRIRNNS